MMIRRPVGNDRFPPMQSAEHAAYPRLRRALIPALHESRQSMNTTGLQLIADDACGLAAGFECLAIAAAQSDARAGSASNALTPSPPFVKAPLSPFPDTLD
jgi:hypothetical protein